MYIYTEAREREYRNVNLFNIESGLRYNFQVNSGHASRFTRVARLEITSAHTAYGEDQYGLVYYDQEAIDFWSQLRQYQAICSQDRDKMAAVGEAAARELTKALDEAAAQEYMEDNNRRSLDLDDEICIPF